MKKLLLLLFISFAFIGLANANSIKGAFGYKLGQVVKDVELYEDRDGFKIKNKSFSPINPMPPFDFFVVNTTLKNNKVYKISAYVWGGVEMDNIYSCTSNKYFSKLLDALENKYGSFDTSWDGHGWEAYLINKGDRQILLKCAQITGLSQNPSPNDEISIYLEYRDNKLYKLLIEENNEFSDYDI